MEDNFLIRASKTVLAIDEGYREKPYLDTKGNWTIGVGHLIGKSLKELTLTKRVIDTMLAEQIDICVSELIEIFGADDFNTWEEARQVALIGMIYNLGKPKFIGFRKMIQAIKLTNWKSAANECLMSKWASDVDPKHLPGVGRDDRIAYMLREGKFHELYKIHS